MKKCLFVLVLLVFLAGCRGWAYKVPTANMVPTINAGDHVIVNQFAYQSGEIQRFDIVVFNGSEELQKITGDKNVKYVKRIIGLPGEKIEIKKGRVFINNSELNEDFEKISDKEDFDQITIPENEYFLMGDNRPNSSDSRFWEKPTVKRSDILGKIIQILPAN